MKCGVGLCVTCAWYSRYM